MEGYKDRVSGHSRCTYAITTVVPVCTSPVQVKASTNPTWRGEVNMNPTLAVVSCWEGK